MTRTRVVNMRREFHDVRIDRLSKWGNPFRVGRDGTREEVIEKYRVWVTTTGKVLLASLGELKGKRLGCWCKPKKCHGDVLVQLIEEGKR